MNFYIRNCFWDLQRGNKFFNTQLKSMKANFIIRVINASLHEANLLFGTNIVNWNITIVHLKQWAKCINLIVINRFTTFHPDKLGLIRSYYSGLAFPSVKVLKLNITIALWSNAQIRPSSTERKSCKMIFNCSILIFHTLFQSTMVTFWFIT